jgi:hypothetical protein
MGPSGSITSLAKCGWDVAAHIVALEQSMKNPIEFLRPTHCCSRCTLTMHEAFVLFPALLFDDRRWYNASTNICRVNAHAITTHTLITVIPQTACQECGSATSKPTRCKLRRLYHRRRHMLLGGGEGKMERRSMCQRADNVVEGNGAPMWLAVEILERYRKGRDVFEEWYR